MRGGEAEVVSYSESLGAGGSGAVIEWCCAQWTTGMAVLRLDHQETTLTAKKKKKTPNVDFELLQTNTMYVQGVHLGIQAKCPVHLIYISSLLSFPSFFATASHPIPIMSSSHFVSATSSLTPSSPFTSPSAVINISCALHSCA